MQTIELPSPAKINLFLDVLRNRDDGYHDIITVFEKIDLCDRIKFAPLEISKTPNQKAESLTGFAPLDSKRSGATEFGAGIEISSNVRELASDENNLVYRACSLLKKRYGISKGVKIHIEKKIPIAAGLGGGSSNAATALKGLNKLWNLNISDRELVGLGKGIGADVPFFIFNDSFAVGTGRGDEIHPIKSDLEMWHVLISPPARVLTKEVYENTNLSLTRPRPDVKILVRAIEENNVGEVKKHLYNALEPVATEKVTDISSAVDFVKGMGFDAVRVTGSGPTIFVLTFEREEAEGLKEKLNSFVSGRTGGDWKIFVAKTAQ